VTTRFLPDSSVLVATILDWHPHHVAASGHLQRLLEAGDEMCLAAHSLLETYAVATRLPAHLRLPPRTAWRLIDESYLRNGVVVGLAVDQRIELLPNLATQSITGGRVYDALIAATARDAGVDVLLTFNRRHFVGLVPGLKIVVPGEAVTGET